MVADIDPGPAGSDPALSMDAQGTFVFVATDGVHGVEPWASDGTPGGTQMLGDVNVGPESSNPSWFTVSGPHLFFSANDGITGEELWAASLS